MPILLQVLQKTARNAMPKQFLETQIYSKITGTCKTCTKPFWVMMHSKNAKGHHH